MQKKIRDHEAFLMTMLQWLKSKRFLDVLAFGGGAMLRLCHELPRYCVAMNFSFIKPETNTHFFQQLSESLFHDYHVVEAQNNDSSILIRIQREEASPPLTITIRKALIAFGDTEEKIAFSPYSSIQVFVRGFTLEHTLRGKVLALLDHGEITDAFDLEFLVRMGLPLEVFGKQKEMLIARLQGFKGKDFDTKLGSINRPDLLRYYRQQGFTYLREKLLFDHWKQKD